MKHCYTLLLVCLFLLGNNACSARSPEESEQSVIAEVAYYCHTEEQYNLLQAKYTSEFPEKYITWKQVSKLGNIDRFWSFMLYKSHFFEITDDSNTRFCLAIDYLPSAHTTQIVDYNDAFFSGESLLNISSETETGLIVKRGNIYYSYGQGGALSYIYWYVVDIEFQIAGLSSSALPSECPPDSLIGKLLSPDEAVANAAFAEITEKLSK